MQTSSILAFRAVNFIVEEFAIRFHSGSLRMLSNEMQPVLGRPSGDQALPHTWIGLWGESTSERTFEGAASIAIKFLEQEGDWGDDDGHVRLFEGHKRGLDVDGNEIWDAWLICLEKARHYSYPGAWAFKE